LADIVALNHRMNIKMETDILRQFNILCISSVIKVPFVGCGVILKCCIEHIKPL
jgi:hypothetical protein